jgi:antitoxin (DNA-binding transcriptional repressor) of toxin-antitoxin stability system
MRTMKQNRTVTAKELKVRTGEVLGMVAEGAVMYVTHRGTTIARLEPVTPGRGEDEVAALDRLIDQLRGKYASLPPTNAVSRAKHREERARVRR